MSCFSMCNDANPLTPPPSRERILSGLSDAMLGVIRAAVQALTVQCVSPLQTRLRVYHS
jgi:hypothetical protein